MAESTPSLLERLTAIFDTPTRIIAAIAAVVTAASGLYQAINENLLVAAGAGVACLVAVALFVWDLARRRRQPPTRLARAEVPRSTTFFRGLRPFNLGDSLLGRDAEVAQVLGMVSDPDFKFGYVEGEAGAGKTSVVRAGLLAAFGEGSSTVAVYVPRPGDNLYEAVRTNQQGPEPGDDQSEEFGDLISGAAAASPGKRLLFIVDQFEEVYSEATRGRLLPQLRSLIEAVSAVRQSSLLFILRTEFVGRLLDYSRHAPQLGNIRWRIPLRNMPADLMRTVVKTAAKSENAPLSPDLIDQVIIDLSRDGLVRPVEMQIVVTALIHENIGDRKGYRRAGSAAALIAGFVKDQVSPRNVPVSPIEVSCAKHILRSLCNDDFNARRVPGLLPQELLGLFDSTESRREGASKRALKQSVDKVLDRLVTTGIVAVGPDGRCSLVHDYLASAVRDATIGYEGPSSRARSTLDQYTRQLQSDARLTLPVRTLLFVKRYVPADRLREPDVRRLFQSSYRHYAMLLAITVAPLCIATLYFVLPTGLQTLRVRDENLGRIQGVSNDGRTIVAVNFTDDRTGLWLVNLTENGPEIQQLDSPAPEASLSPDGHFIALDKVNQIEILDTVTGVSQHVAIGNKVRTFRLLVFASQDSGTVGVLAPSGDIVAGVPGDLRSVPLKYVLTDGDPNAVRLVERDTIPVEFTARPSFIFLTSRYLVQEAPAGLDVFDLATGKGTQIALSVRCYDVLENRNRHPTVNALTDSIVIISAGPRVSRVDLATGRVTLLEAPNGQAAAGPDCHEEASVSIAPDRRHALVWFPSAVGDQHFALPGEAVLYQVEANGTLSGAVPFESVVTIGEFDRSGQYFMYLTAEFGWIVEGVDRNQLFRAEVEGQYSPRFCGAPTTLLDVRVPGSFWGPDPLDDPEIVVRRVDGLAISQPIRPGLPLPNVYWSQDGVHFYVATFRGDIYLGNCDDGSVRHLVEAQQSADSIYTDRNGRLWVRDGTRLSAYESYAYLLGLRLWRTALPPCCVVEGNRIVAEVGWW